MGNSVPYDGNRKCHQCHRSADQLKDLKIETDTCQECKIFACRKCSRGMHYVSSGWGEELRCSKCCKSEENTHAGWDLDT